MQSASKASPSSFTPMIKIVDNFFDINYAQYLNRLATSRTDLNHSTFSGYESIDFLQLELPDDVISKHFPELHAYKLVRSWGFIYESGSQGVPPHADPADLNLNIWLTPNECIDDASMNGLKIWTLRRPEDWSFSSYNANTKKIRDFIGNARPVHIPYQFNRATLFCSSFFHATDNVSTLPGLQNRRVSYTFLFQKQY